MLTRTLQGEELETWLRDQVNHLKEGGSDGKLVYQKRIRKAVSEYAQNAPPHIRAARMLSNPGRDIRYVFTKRGPVPEELQPNDIDYEHYIQKQIQPIAEIVLALKGKTFKSVTEPEQISLF
jgi:DNA polymerase-2